MQSKTSLRRQTYDRLAELTESALLRYTQVINQKLNGLIDWNETTTVCVYQARQSWQEIDLGPFLAWLHSNYPRTHVYVVTTSKHAALPSQSFDVVILPLVAFDARGNRLGRGSGWYDRLLAAQSESTISIGIGLSIQQIPEIPVESHDQSLNYIVTERSITSH